MIRNYNDFVEALLKAGFSMGGGSDDGIYAVLNWSWGEAPPVDTPVRWHTGDQETDPWEWRIRVLNERNDIVYSKIFFRKSGYITKEWYPYFLAVRRGDTTFNEAYADGTISHFAKRIYTVVNENKMLPVEEIKKLAGFSRGDKSGFDRALTELQMKMYLTVCGTKQKISRTREEYGWPSTVFCPTEHFFGTGVFDKAAEISEEEAIDKIREQILKLNPEAKEKDILKFIKG